MGLTQQLGASTEQLARMALAGRAALYDAEIEELRATFALGAVIGVGSIAPSFDLPVVTFYRDGWRPCCNIQLKAYQAILPEHSEATAQADASLQARRTS